MKNTINCKICKASFKPVTKIEKQTSICYVCQFNKDIHAIDKYIQKEYGKDLKNIKNDLKGGKRLS